MQREPIWQRAKGRWLGILTKLGVHESYLTGNHGPCPLCGGKDRFRFDDKNGRGTYFCNSCGSGDGVKLIQQIRGWDFKTAAKEIEGVIGDAAFVQPETPKTDNAEQLRKMWGESRPVSAGDPVTRYLANRGIEWTPEIRNLRYCERMAYRDRGDEQTTYHPGMLAVIMDAGGKAVSMHRTYITLDGHKARVPSVRKAMAGKIPIGSAIRLRGHGSKLGIAEGIETALSASLCTSMPVWATLNATLMGSWEPPEGVSQIVVFGDNDSSYTGQATAYTLARRLVVAGHSVSVAIPSIVNTDWNDVWLNRARRQAA